MIWKDMKIGVPNEDGKYLIWDGVEISIKYLHANMGFDEYNTSNGKITHFSKISIPPKISNDWENSLTHTHTIPENNQSGYNIFVFEDETSGRHYFTDAIGGGACFWSVFLADIPTMEFAIEIEKKLRNKETI